MGEYTSLDAALKESHAIVRARELSRCVKLLNELYERKREAVQGLGLEGAKAVEELMEEGFGDLSWADIVLVASLQVLPEARNLILE